MASWKDRLRPASFRGIAFFIDSSQYTGGRRVAFHEFPDRDNPFAEDLGKVGQTFRVEGHILGDTYFDTKKSLLDAANQEGPGELVHPYYGTLLVQCGAFSIDEDNREGRIAKISFQFYEAGDNRYPKEVDDKQFVLEEKTLSALDKSKAEFDRRFSIAKLPGFAVDTARKSVADAANFFENATKGLQTQAKEIADLAFAIRNLRAETNDLLQSPAELSQRLADSFSLLEAALGLPKDKLKGAQVFAGFGSGDAAIPTTTPIRQKQDENKRVFDDFMKRTGTVQAVNAASVVEFESVDEASEIRDTLRDQIDDILLTAEDDDVFQAFQDVKAQLARVLPDADADLPNVQTITVQDTNPSLVVAYDLFEVPEAEEDLINRNKIAHPGFVLGGSTLEVIDVRKSS
jgi:prophage DNA circulation protein